MFRLNQASGWVADGTTDGLRQGPKIEWMYEADAAIEVGEPVALGTTDTSGRLAIVALTATSSKCLGVYEGHSDKGGSGSAPTETDATASENFHGKDAADGDIIWVTAVGKVLTCVGGTTSVIADGDILDVSTLVNRSGFINRAAAPAAATQASFIAMEATSTTTHLTGYIRTVFVRCL